MTSAPAFIRFSGPIARRLLGVGLPMGPNQLHCEDAFETLMPGAMHIVETFPGYQVPFRDVWLQAMEVVSVGRACAR